MWQQWGERSTELLKGSARTIPLRHDQRSGATPKRSWTLCSTSPST